MKINYPQKIDPLVIRFITSKVKKTATIQYWFSGKEIKLKIFNDDFSEVLDLTDILSSYDIWSEPKSGSGPLVLGNYQSWGQYVQAATGLSGVLRSKAPSKDFRLQIMPNKEF